MLGNLMLPKSPENRRQGAQDPHYQVQHQAPIISQPKKLAAMTHTCTLFIKMHSGKKKCEAYNSFTTFDTCQLVIGRC
jgi:hypothetical protein